MKKIKKVTKKQVKKEYKNTIPKKSGFLATIFKYYRTYPVLYTIAILATIFSSLLTVLIPRITNDYITQGFNPTKVVELTYILVGIQVGSGILMYIKNLSGSAIGIKIEIEYRNKVLEHLLKVDMSYYEQNKIGESLTKLISDTQVIGENMQAIPLTFLSSIVTFIGGMSVAISINWQMSLIVLGIILIIGLIGLISVRIIKYLNYTWRKVYTEVNADVTDRISTIGLIKSNGTQDSEMQRFLKDHKRYYKSAIKTINFDSFARALLVTLLTGINTVGLITGIIFASKGIIQQAVIISFMLAVNTLIFPIIQSIQFLTNWAKTSTSILRINEILHVKPKIFDTSKSIKIDAIKGDIVFKNISFRYNNESPWILKDFNYTFKKGKNYAIVGATGSGKSTISKLLLRFYDPNSGEILINNINLKQLNLKSYLKHIGYIEQDPQILYGDFIENIKYTRENATFAEVQNAAEKANLDGYIRELPDDYETILGERGMNLSGGQKQRVAIARIFLKDPQLLILDEATSALDNIVEKEIQTQFNKLMDGRTSIIIAHRLSTIKNVDEILVIEKNVGLVQTGTFEELKTKNGHFKNLYQAGLME